MGGISGAARNRQRDESRERYKSMKAHIETPAFWHSVGTWPKLSTNSGVAQDTKKRPGDFRLRAARLALRANHFASLSAFSMILRNFGYGCAPEMK